MPAPKKKPSEKAAANNGTGDVNPQSRIPLSGEMVGNVSVCMDGQPLDPAIRAAVQKYAEAGKAHTSASVRCVNVGCARNV